MKKRSLIGGEDAGDLLELTDISVGESEELPQILHPLAYEAANAALGRDPAPEAGGGALGSHILIQSIEAGAPALLKLRVRPILTSYYMVD